MASFSFSFPFTFAVTFSFDLLFARCHFSLHCCCCHNQCPAAHAAAVVLVLLLLPLLPLLVNFDITICCQRCVLFRLIEIKKFLSFPICATHSPLRLLHPSWLCQSRCSKSQTHLTALKDIFIEIHGIACRSAYIMKQKYDKNTENNKKLACL